MSEHFKSKVMSRAESDKVNALTSELLSLIYGEGLSPVSSDDIDPWFQLRTSALRQALTHVVTFEFEARCHEECLNDKFIHELVEQNLELMRFIMEKSLQNSLDDIKNESN